MKTPLVATDVRKDHVTSLLTKRFPTALGGWWAGSLSRGEGTVASDIDLVVLFTSLPYAYRTSFHWRGVPVEAFVHDPDTLHYFYEEDARSGRPCMQHMVSTGIWVGPPSERAVQLQASAAYQLAHPPEVVGLDAQRYALTDHLDDLTAPRSQGHAAASAAAAYPAVANFFLRSNGHWGAGRKAIVDALVVADPAFAQQFQRAFTAAFAGETRLVVALIEQILAPHGGRLFDGYRLDAPASWRRTPGEPETATP